MKDGAPFVLAWAGWLLVLGVGLLIWSGEAGPAALLAGSALPLWALALYHRARPAEDRPRAVPSSSVAVVLLALGALLIANGLTAGLWLVLAGAELAAAGAFLLVRELIGERRARR
jgi:predicted lysophospholipase L1 biosynthesis ABC-type transport system permease subunit